MQETLINRNKFHPWIIWAASVSFVFFQFFLQLSSGVMVKSLMHAFAISAFGAGILSSTYYYIYVTLQTPAGALVDRFGPRRLLTLGALITGLGCWIFAQSQHVLPAELGRLLMGGGSSCAFVGTMYLIGKWFPPGHFALILGVTETAGMLSAIGGNVFLAEILDTLGWRNSMLVGSAVATGIAFLCWTIVRDRPSHLQAEECHITREEFFKDVKSLLKLPVIWINGVYSGLMFSVITVFVALWSIPFFATKLHISNLLATEISSVAFLGMGLFSPVSGWIVSRLAKPHLLLPGAAMINACLMLWVIFATPVHTVALSLIMFVMGALCSVYVINYDLAYRYAPASAKSTSVGVTNTLTMMMAPILQPLVGYLLDLHDYHTALLVVPVCLFLAAGLAFFIRPMYNA